jgi:hypothetical protein
MQDKTLVGSHGDAVVSGDRAWWFYFTERGRRAVINVVELSLVEGKLTLGDPGEPTCVDLKGEREPESEQLTSRAGPARTRADGASSCKTGVFKNDVNPGSIHRWR